MFSGLFQGGAIPPTAICARQPCSLVLNSISAASTDVRRGMEIEEDSDLEVAAEQKV